MRVAFHGWIGHGNLGEELQYMAHMNAFTKWQFHPYERNPEREFDAACVSDTFINEHDQRLEQTKDMLRRCNAVYCLGAGVSHPAFWSTRPGWKNRMTEWCRLLEQFKYVGVRGPVSRRLLEQAGCSAKIRVVGDAAIALAPDKPSPEPKVATIGISAGHSWNNMWGGDEHAIHVKLLDICRRLQAEGLSIQLLSIWPQDDERCKALAAQAGCSFSHLHLPDTEKIKTTFSRYTAFLGLKLHTTILAAMNRVPVYALEYRPKCRDFMESIGLQWLVADTGTFDPAQVAGAVLQLIKHRKSMVSYLDAEMEQRKRIWHQSAREVQQIVEQSVVS